MKFGGWQLDAVTGTPQATQTGWGAYGDGFATDDTVRHTGRHSIRAENTSATDVRGAVQTFDFTAGQKLAYTVTAWSRAKNVSGSPNPNYSLYADATCADGTVCNGHATPFVTGTHDWQQVKLELNPPGSLRSLKIYTLFRKKTGRVWFDEVRMQATPNP